METKDQTCESRIDEYLAGRLEDILPMYETGELSHEYGLCIDYVCTEDYGWTGPDYARYQLGWGGPSDEFRFFADGTIEYWFLDWFDGAHRDVSEHAWAQWLREYMPTSKETHGYNRS